MNLFLGSIKLELILVLESTGSRIFFDEIQFGVHLKSDNSWHHNENYSKNYNRHQKTDAALTWRNLKFIN